MKTIEQLLKLSQNPHYTFTPTEKEVLDDFLSQKQEKVSKPSRRSSSKKLSKRTPVIVRNVVKKVDTSIEEV